MWLSRVLFRSVSASICAVKALKQLTEFVEIQVDLQHHAYDVNVSQA